jgi:hypothetical protein
MNFRKKTTTLSDTIATRLETDRLRVEKIASMITTELYNPENLSPANIRNADIFNQELERVYEIITEGKPLERLTNAVLSDKKEVIESTEDLYKNKDNGRAKRYLRKSDAIRYCEQLDIKANRAPVSQSGYRQRINLGVKEGEIKVRKKDNFVRSRDVRIWNAQY